MSTDDKLLLVGRVLKVLLVILVFPILVILNSQRFRNNSKLILKHDWIVYHWIEKGGMIMSYGVKSMIIKCAIKID